jgi:hypothetical protein
MDRCIDARISNLPAVLNLRFKPDIHQPRRHLSSAELPLEDASI